MKNYQKALIRLCSGIVLMFTLTLLVGLGTTQVAANNHTTAHHSLDWDWDWDWGDRGTTITLEDEVSIAGVNRVNIRSTIQRVRVHAIDGNEARVVSSGIPTNSTLVVDVEDGVLTVETRLPRIIILRNFTTPTLDVYLPAIMYEQIRITSTTGRVEISDFDVNDLRIHVTAGAIDVSDIAGNVNLRTTTGRITASRITGEDLRFRATVGVINLSDLIGDIDAQTLTGRISFNNPTINQNVNVETTAGSIEINLENEPAHASFNLRTTTGRTTLFGSNSATQQFGDGRYEVTLRTRTGRITVR